MTAPRRSARLSPAERAALIACHRGGVEGMRIPGVIMVSCATVSSLMRKGAFDRGALSADFAPIARALSDAEHEARR